MVDFVGRRQELATLERELQKVAAGVGGERPGRCVMLRGRRRVGKSRLVERFAERSGAPFLFYAATGASPRIDLARLARDAQASTLQLAGLVAAGELGRRVRCAGCGAARRPGERTGHRRGAVPDGRRWSL